MRATGIVRRIDDLGRIVIPKELRKSIGVRAGDVLEICVDTETNGLLLIPYASQVSCKIRGIAETLSSLVMTEECWEIADELKILAEKLEKLEKNS